MASFSCEMFTSLFFSFFFFVLWLDSVAENGVFSVRSSYIIVGSIFYLVDRWSELAYTILLYCETENKIRSRKRESKEGEDGRRESNSL